MANKRCLPFVQLEACWRPGRQQGSSGTPHRWTLSWQDVNQFGGNGPEGIGEQDASEESWAADAEVAFDLFGEDAFIF